ncbi:GFA family protein [Litorimonas sp. RW-G-Af-16]|uniref:GFA family protein n=1 Tax=Litorimonas sp. RW-G-Af-16 TaxID=3241168 RepID=UPI00390C5182
MAALNGKCLCGGVSFTVAAPTHLDSCHCADCRRWSGGPNISLDFSAVDFKSDKTLAWFQNSDWAERGFCKTCGSSLFYRLIEDHSKMTVCAGAVDGISDDVKITKEFFIEQKPAFYDFAGERERLTGAEVFALYSAEEDS